MCCSSRAKKTSKSVRTASREKHVKCKTSKTRKSGGGGAAKRLDDSLKPSPVLPMTQAKSSNAYRPPSCCAKGDHQNDQNWQSGEHHATGVEGTPIQNTNYRDETKNRARSFVQHHYHDHGFQPYAFLEPSCNNCSVFFPTLVKNSRPRQDYAVSNADELFVGGNREAGLKAPDDRVLQTLRRRNSAGHWTSPSIHPSEDRRHSTMNPRTAIPQLLVLRSTSRDVFPVKLYNMLQDAENEEDTLRSIVSWQPHGRSFMVHKPREFVTAVLRRYFKGQRRLTSFQRQLNLYGFKRLSQGSDRGAYYHELFLRGRPFLVRNILRTETKGNRVKPTPNPGMEPDFYKMRPCLENDGRGYDGINKAFAHPLLSAPEATPLLHGCCTVPSTDNNVLVLSPRNTSVDSKQAPAALPEKVKSFTSSLYFESKTEGKEISSRLLSSCQRTPMKSSVRPFLPTDLVISGPSSPGFPQFPSDYYLSAEYNAEDSSDRRPIGDRKTSTCHEIPHQQNLRYWAIDHHGSNVNLLHFVRPKVSTSTTRDDEFCIPKPADFAPPGLSALGATYCYDSEEDVDSYHRDHSGSQCIDGAQDGKEDYRKTEDEDDPLLDRSIDDVDPEMLDAFESIFFMRPNCSARLVF